MQFAWCRWSCAISVPDHGFSQAGVDGKALLRFKRRERGWQILVSDWYDRQHPRRVTHSRVESSA
jgi:hypothetical protein